MVSTPTIRGKLAELLQQPEARVTDSAILADLALDSFALVDMVIELQERLDIRFDHEDLRDIKTVGDLLRRIEAKAKVNARSPRARYRRWLGYLSASATAAEVDRSGAAGTAKS